MKLDQIQTIFFKNFTDYINTTFFLEIRHSIAINISSGIDTERTTMLTLDIYLVTYHLCGLANYLPDNHSHLPDFYLTLTLTQLRILPTVKFGRSRLTHDYRHLQRAK